MPQLRLRAVARSGQHGCQHSCAPWHTGADQTEATGLHSRRGPTQPCSSLAQQCPPFSQRRTARIDTCMQRAGRGNSAHWKIWVGSGKCKQMRFHASMASRTGAAHPPNHVHDLPLHGNKEEDEPVEDKDGPAAGGGAHREGGQQSALPPRRHPVGRCKCTTAQHPPLLRFAMPATATCNAGCLSPLLVPAPAEAAAAAAGVWSCADHNRQTCHPSADAHQNTGTSNIGKKVAPKPSSTAFALLHLQQQQGQWPERVCGAASSLQLLTCSAGAASGAEQSDHASGRERQQRQVGQAAAALPPTSAGRQQGPSRRSMTEQKAQRTRT